MSKVLVTGADGFIGSHLVELLHLSGFDVKALVQYNSINSIGWLNDISLKNEIEIISGDIRDPFLCQKIIKDVDIVFNLAALIAIPYSYIAPQSYIETNIHGALNICQAALRNGNCKVVQISTSEVYGTAQYVPIDENHPLQPQSPYSASKISSDAIAMSFNKSFDLPVVIARPFNTYGPRQSARAVIPTIISQILNNKEEIFLGDTSPTRDFTYVEDTCRGILNLAKSEESIGEVTNIGSSFEISILDLFKLIKKLMNSNIILSFDKTRERPKNSEVYRLFCDNKKIKRTTNFEIIYDIEAGLLKTIEWMQNPENFKLYDPSKYNL